MGMPWVANLSEGVRRGKQRFDAFYRILQPGPQSLTQVTKAPRAEMHEHSLRLLMHLS